VRFARRERPLPAAYPALGGDERARAESPAS
jgi:hypothetical protein